MKQEAIGFLEEHGIADSSTDEKIWTEFISHKPEGIAYRIPDTTVVGIPAKNRRLRKDKAQVLFYGISYQDQWCVRLMPAQALVLCLFNGRRTLREVAGALSFIDGCSFQAADLKVRRFLEWIQFGREEWLHSVPSDADLKSYKTFDFRDFCIPQVHAKKTNRLDKPVSLMIMPTEKCQTDCLYCYACRRPVRPKDHLPIGRIHKLIDEAAAMGVNMVNLDGGDMLSRKEIVEIVQHLRDNEIHITASTKGYVSRKLAKQLCAAGLTYIQVGLDAPTPQVADFLVGRKGFFQRMMETIINLTEAGITTRTNSIITSSTVELVPALVDFLMTLPVDNIKICPAFRSYFKNGGDIILTHEQKERLRSTLKEYEEKYSGRGVNWECSEDVLDMTPQERADRFYGRPLCSSARTQCIITPDGKVVTCEQSPQSSEFVVGDLRTQSLQEVWDSKAMKSFWRLPRRKFRNTPCYECQEFEACIHSKGHCFMDSLKAYGTVYAPSPYCPKAPLPAERWN